MWQITLLPKIIQNQFFGENKTCSEDLLIISQEHIALKPKGKSSKDMIVILKLSENRNEETIFNVHKFHTILL